MRTDSRDQGGLARLRRSLRRGTRPLRRRVEMLRAAIHFRTRPARRPSYEPHFLGIGGQKCGTTWLDRMLRYHPDIGLPDLKELHYFNTNAWRGGDWYRFQFRGLEDRIRGEITPAYSILRPEQIRAVREWNPDFRLVLILRNPVERAWSQAEMYLARNRRRPMESVPDAEILRHLESDDVLSRSRFGEILRNWLSVFPAEQLRIELFEEIATDPAGLLARVLTHIGADPARMPWGEVPMARRFNANPGTAIPERFRARLRERLADDMAELRRLVPREEARSW